MEGVWPHFTELLRTRLEADVFTTEDSIRYTFYFAFCAKTGIQPHEIVLEFPHPQIRRAQVDTYVPRFRGASLAVEFKYDRQIPSGQAIPKPQNAGELFKDMYRLARFHPDHPVRRLLVYIADPLMVVYFRNPANGHSRFFSLPQGESMSVQREYLRGKANTFVNSLGAEPDFKLACVWRAGLPKGNELRVLEVTPPQMQ